MRSIVIAPTTPETIYAGTPNGVFKRTSSVSSWTRMSNGLTDLDVRVLAIAPDAPATVLAGTSSGVFKTIDGAGSWSPATSGLPAGGVAALAFDVLTPDTIYAGTVDGVYKSIDSGSTWHAANMHTAGLTVPSIAVDPFTPGTVYAAAGREVYRSVDGGATWGTRSNGLDPGPGLVEAIAAHPFLPGSLVTAKRYTLTAGTVVLNLADEYWSTNSGETWARRSLNVFGVSRVYGFDFDLVRRDILFMVTDRGVIRSDAGGRDRWSSPSRVGALATAIAVDREVPWTVWAASDEGALRGDYAFFPNSVGWSGQNRGLVATSVASVGVDATDPNVVHALSGRGVFRSSNGGSHWARVSVGAAWQVPAVLVTDPVDSGVVYVGLNHEFAPTNHESHVIRSIDGGATWSPIWGSTTQDIAAFVVDPVRPGTLYAVTTSTLLKTIDGGHSWFPVSGSNLQALAIAPSDSNTLYAADTIPRVLLKSRNGGVSWERYVVPSPIREILVDPFDAETVLLRTDGGVFVTTNGGNTWSARNTGLPSTDLTALTFDPLAPSTLYAGSRQGVFTSSDRGASWTPFSDGLAVRTVRSLAVTHSYPARIYAGTDGTGVYSRTGPLPSFDTAARAIPAVFRPSTAQWFVRRSTGLLATTFGDPALGDRPVPADYDGDGLRDIAVYRSGTAEWLVLRSSDGRVVSTRLGEPGRGDLPAPADYDGDGRTDFAIYRQPTRVYYILHSSTGEVVGYGPHEGNPASPVPADYDGDGRADPAVVYQVGPAWRWVIWGSVAPTRRDVIYGSHVLGDMPQPGDYDGDGKADVAVYRQTTGQWFIYGSTAGQLPPIQFGSPVQDDIPVAGDYDGDGRADVAVYRKPTGEWFWFGSSSGFSGPVAISGTAPGDIPLTGVR